MDIFEKVKKVAKRKRKTMDELAEGYKQFIKSREVNPNGAERFAKVIKKAVKPIKPEKPVAPIKQRGSK